MIIFRTHCCVSDGKRNLYVIVSDNIISLRYTKFRKYFKFISIPLNMMNYIRRKNNMVLHALYGNVR